MIAIFAGTLISLWQWHIFLRVGYSNLPLMAVVDFLTVAVKVIAASPLVFLSHRILFPEMTVARRKRTNIVLNASKYLGISMFLFSMNDFGFIFCVLGDSERGPGLVATYIISLITCLLWVRIIAIFPALSVGGDKTTLSSAVKSVKGRFFQIALVLGVTIIPVTFILRPVFYFWLILLIRRFSAPTNLNLLSDAAWYASYSLVFILTWVLVAVVGSHLYHDSLGRNWAAEIERDPEESDWIYNPRARKT